MLSAAPTLLINPFLLVNKSLLLLLVNLAPIKLGWWGFVVFFFLVMKQDIKEARIRVFLPRRINTKFLFEAGIKARESAADLRTKTGIL